MGFGGFSLVAALAIGVALVASALLRSSTLAALAMVVSAGVLGARAAQAHERLCEKKLAIATIRTVALIDSAYPGAWARGQIVDGDCTARGALTVMAGSASAGDVVIVNGTPIAAGPSLLIRDASVRSTGRSVARLALRARAERSVRRTFGTDAPLALALLLAETRDLSPEMRDRYADAGVVHMLSISGLHVGIVAASIVLLASVVRVPQPLQWPAGALVTIGYVLLIGAPPAALRAAAMVIAVAASRALQRPTSPWALLAIGAAAPLADPRIATDIGYQLSVIGIIALIGSAALSRRFRRDRRVRALPAFAQKVAAGLLTSIVASLVTAPLVAWSFGRLSIAGPIVNLVADPILGLAQPMLFLALVLAPIPALAEFVAHAAHPLLMAFDRVAVIGAGIPHAAIAVAPRASTTIALAVASTAMLAACLRRHPAPALLAAAAALCMAAWMPEPAGNGEVELHMIDVGQGDAFALRTPAGRWILIDAGRAWRGSDAGKQTVLPYLRRRGGALVAFVLSHPHADHAGGAATVIAALRPQEYWDAAFAGGSETYHASLVAASESGVEWKRVHPTDSLDVDGVVLRFLAPDSAWTTSLADPNNASTILLVRFGSVRFLLVGDAEADEEAWLLRHSRSDLRADVLKVGHHGSRTSSTPDFLAAVSPRVALVSVGLGNDYGHPDTGVMSALARSGATVVRSDISGSAVVRTDGHSLTLESKGESWSLRDSSHQALPCVEP